MTKRMEEAPLTIMLYGPLAKFSVCVFKVLCFASCPREECSYQQTQLWFWWIGRWGFHMPLSEQRKRAYHVDRVLCLIPRGKWDCCLRNTGRWVSQIPLKDRLATQLMEVLSAGCFQLSVTSQLQRPASPRARPFLDSPRGAMIPPELPPGCLRLCQPCTQLRSAQFCFCPFNIPGIDHFQRTQRGNRAHSEGDKEDGWDSREPPGCLLHCHSHCQWQECSGILQ